MPLFLVRHAKAGSRQKWTGPDRLRPLSSAGREQAEAMARRLGEFPVARVLSSPALRCVQTVEPIAGKAGLAVEPTEILSEGKSAGPVVDLLAELPDYSILCTHGDVLPDTIAALQSRKMVVHGAPEWRKGAIWALDRVDGTFLRARAAYPEP